MITDRNNLLSHDDRRRFVVGLHEVCSIHTHMYRSVMSEVYILHKVVPTSLNVHGFLENYPGSFKHGSFHCNTLNQNVNIRISK